VACAFVYTSFALLLPSFWLAGWLSRILIGWGLVDAIGGCDKVTNV